MEILIANNAESITTTDLTAAATSITVRSADASKFPNPSAGTQAFYATLERKNTGECEVVLVTARVGAVLTVTRAQDGTTALTFSSGDTVSVRMNKAAVDAYLAQQTAYLPQKNAIIGGDFGTNPWQLGTSFVSPASGTYSADNIKFEKATTGDVTISKSADGPSVAQAGRLITHCLLVACTTADVAIAAGDAATIGLFIEGYDWQPYAQRALALRFWHKHTKTGTYCVALRNAGSNRSLVMEYTQAVADAWEEAILDLPASPSAGTWDYTNGVGAYVTFTLMSGTTFQTTAGAWQTGNFIATSNQVNALDSNTNNFRIADVRLGAGSAAYARFIVRTRPEELLLAQRTYEKSYDVGTAPGTAVVAGVREAFGLSASVVSGFDFAVRKRIAPAVKLYNRAGTADKIASVLTGAAVGTVVTAGSIGETSVQAISDSGAGITANIGYEFHFTADARF